MKMLATINNMTNHELVLMCESKGHAVNADMVKVLCERIDNATSELSMFRTLADNTNAVNKRLQTELKAFQTELSIMMGD